VSNAGVNRDQVEALIVELYRLRNQFLHSGVHPYRADIAICGMTTTTGRVVRTGQILLKLALHAKLNFTEDGRQVKTLAGQVQEFFRSGSFAPPGTKLQV
jgi:hypothetical protein